MVFTMRSLSFKSFRTSYARKGLVSSVLMGTHFPEIDNPLYCLSDHQQRHVLHSSLLPLSCYANILFFFLPFILLSNLSILCSNSFLKDF